MEVLTATLLLSSIFFGASWFRARMEVLSMKRDVDQARREVDFTRKSCLI